MHCIVLLLVDLALIVFSTEFALLISSNLKFALDEFFEGLPYLGLTLASAVPVLVVTGLNRTLWRFTDLADGLLVIIATLTVALTVFLSFAFGQLANVPSTLPLQQGLLTIYALGGVRLAMRLRHGKRSRREEARRAADYSRRGAVLIIGINQLTELYLRTVADSPTGRVEIAGILSSRSRHLGRLFRSHRVLGRPEELERVIHDLAVHGVLITRIVLALPLEQLSAASQAALLQAHSTFDVGVEKLSERFGTNCQAAVLNTPADDNAVRVLFDREVGLSTYFKWKRLLDLSAALLCILCLAPIMLLVAVVVLLDVGYPAIFWQQRPGILGRPIKVLKFRTMRAARDQQGKRLADEERLSAIGRFLRLVRLDELPQIYNVLIGEMSFVGPRPLLPKDQSPGAVARLCIRPGLTGWAQIHGGRHLSMHDKAALDLWYVKNASFALDLAILVSTFRILLFGERVDLGAIRAAWRELGCEPPDVVETSRTSGAQAC